MTKLEYSDLYKFLVSLGIVLIGLSLFAPWLFLRESFDALLKASDILDLTPTAQALLNYRQQAALWFVRNVWWISLILAIGGLLPLIMGIVLWVRRQRVLDQREKIETRKVGLEAEILRHKLESQTPAQIAIGAMEEITEEVEAEEAPQLSMVRSVKSGVQEYLRVEETFLNKLVDCYGYERTLIRQQSTDAAYDAILMSDSPELADVVFEVKRLTRDLSLHRLRAVVDQISRSIQDYAVLRMRLTTTVVGIALFVVPEDDRVTARTQEYLQVTRDQADLYGVRVDLIFITEKELQEIRCSELQDKINSIAAGVPASLA
jgi:hypothetical protein